MKQFNNFLYTYINNSAKAGDLNDWSLQNFASWVDRSKLSNAAKQKAVQWAQSNEAGFVALFDIIHGIMKVKNDIIRELDSKPAEIQANSGGKPEEKVKIRDRKLNRDEFTRNNIETTIMEEKKYTAPNMPYGDPCCEEDEQQVRLYK